MKRNYSLPDQLDAFFEAKTQGMNRNALIVALVTKWLFSNLEVVKEYDEYIEAIREDQRGRMFRNHWKNKSEKYPKKLDKTK